MIKNGFNQSSKFLHNTGLRVPIKLFHSVGICRVDKPISVGEHFQDHYPRGRRNACGTNVRVISVKLHPIDATRRCISTMVSTRYVEMQISAYCISSKFLTAELGTFSLGNWVNIHFSNLCLMCPKEPLVPTPVVRIVCTRM